MWSKIVSILLLPFTLASIAGQFPQLKKEVEMIKQQQEAYKYDQKAIEEGLFNVVNGLHDLENQLPVMDSTKGGEVLGASFNYVGGKNYFLYGGGVGSSDTSITLTSFTLPTNTNYKLSMTDFGSIGYVTIEPGNSTRQEFASFTGVTQNSDNSATLTGVTRGLAPVSPYTASSTLQKAHPGGSIVVISNPPQLYNQLTAKVNPEAVTGLWTFTDPPIMTNAATSSLQAASIAYANGLSLQGAPTSTEALMGTVVLSTNAQSLAGTASNTTQKPLVLGTRLATSSPVGTTGGGGWIPVLNASGQLNFSFIATSSNYLWTGSTSFAGNFTAVKGTTTNATTTNLQISGYGSTSQMTIGTLGVGTATTTQRNAEIAGDLYVKGNCSNCVSSVATSSGSTSLGTSANNQTGLTATCAAGRAIGGGYLIDTASPANYVVYEQNLYTSTTYHVSVVCNVGGGCASGNLKVHVYCTP